MQLDAPVTSLRGLTSANRTALATMGIETLKDLIFYFPARYDDFTATRLIAELEPEDQATVIAVLKSVRSRRGWRRRVAITEAVVADESGEIGLLWFGQPFIAKQLVVGDRYRFAGKVAKNKYGTRIANPRYEAAAAEAPTYAAPIMPVYPLSAGISQRTMVRLVRACLPLANELAETLPQQVMDANGLMPLAEAVKAAHFPPTAARREAARRRLAFDELFKMQLAVGRTRALRGERSAAAVPFDEAATREFVASLPFPLTGDQKKAAWEAIRDTGRGVPMHRLVDGDVGSGKTAVAAIVMANAARAGFQCALMAPTEILARQHFETLSRYFSGSDIATALVTNAYKRSSRAGKTISCGSKAERAALLDAVAEGEIRVVIGTHALIEQAVGFAKLALVVIDEQHRFGVNARRALVGKSGMPGLEPHLLSMTATPIPRSLALTVFGDLDLSLIKEKPKERLPISTALVSPRERKKTESFVHREIAAGRQAFYVCPLIDESDTLGAASVKEMYRRLSQEIFPDLAIGMLHGRMGAAEKEAVMDDFLRKKIHLLVSTSVVEVGVDVPNASVMCIEGAERFGLAQLHQFRGRVGRGAHQSYCFLLPSDWTTAIKQRLSALVKHADGFALAEMDLRLRGPGDILGDTQSGLFPDLRLANFDDLGLIRAAREAAAEILDSDPQLTRHAALKIALEEKVARAHLE